MHNAIELCIKTASLTVHAVNTTEIERHRHHEEKEEEEIEQEEVEENITDADDIKRACIGTIRAQRTSPVVLPPLDDLCTTIRLHIDRI